MKLILFSKELKGKSLDELAEFAQKTGLDGLYADKQLVRVWR